MNCGRLLALLSFAVVAGCNAVSGVGDLRFSDGQGGAGAAPASSSSTSSASSGAGGGSSSSTGASGGGTAQSSVASTGAGAAETDCINGDDDDADGDVDCADADCSAFSCEDVPVGWTFVKQVGAADACSAVETPTDVVACSDCECDKTQDGVCHVLYTVYGNASCTQTLGSGTTAPNCIGAVFSSEKLTLTVKTPGVCDVVPPVESPSRLCAPTLTGGGCGGGAACVPPSGGLACVVQDGDLACPVAYPYRTSIGDAPGSCSCSCSAAVTCGGGIQALYGNNGCNGAPIAMISPDGMCHDTTNAGSSKVAPATAVTTCTATGGPPGTPKTLCCK